MARPILRPWQVRCKEAVKECFLARLAAGRPLIFKGGACVGAGKSTMMAHLAHEFTVGELAEEIVSVDFNVFVAPNLGIIGSHGGIAAGAARPPCGLLGALVCGGIYALEKITALRLPGLMAFPSPEVTDAGMTGVAAVFTYHYLSQKAVQDTLLAWMAAGHRIALHYDEIHHVPQQGTAWADILQRINDAAAAVFYWSGTWFRTDGHAIYDQIADGDPGLNFCYSYSEGIEDGHVRPVSFWIPHVKAQSCDLDGVVVDERPVSDYLEALPPHVRKEMFDPEGWFIDSLIERANLELARRRVKYPDAGCLVICPPGIHRTDDDPDDTDDAADNRIAEVIHRRLCEMTGEHAILVLNGDDPARIIDYANSTVKFIVAVNRVSEGVDIPRLRLLLLLRDLSNTRLMFEQAIGRVIRRRKEDDEEPALVIMPPIHAMCEFARQINIAKKGATPKPVITCNTCRRYPCSCPCRRCQLPRRRCTCVCEECLEKPCVCPPIPLRVFAQLEEMPEAHIANGTDILDRHATRAGAIIKQVEICRHRDLAAIGFILQCDEEINGAAPQESVEVMQRRRVVDKALRWTELRDAMGAKVKQLAFKSFRGHGGKTDFAAAWRHINNKFFPDTRWKNVSEHPDKVSLAKLAEIHTYIDSILKGGRR